MIGMWREQAACRDHPEPKIFLDEHFVGQARKFCDVCPVRDDCLADVGRWERTWQVKASGIYGGLTTSERTGRRRWKPTGASEIRKRTTLRCVVCGEKMADRGSGSLPRYCSTPCRYESENARKRLRRAQGAA